MDPATIAGLCLAITRNAVAFITGISDIRSNYREAGLNVRNLRRQTDLLRLAADRIQAWMNRPGARLSEEEQRIFNDSVQACRMYVEMLRQAADATLGVRNDGQERIARWRRVRFLWEQARLDRYLVTEQSNHKFQFLTANSQSNLPRPGEEERRERFRSPAGTSIINEALSSASSTSSEISTATRSIFSDSDDRPSSNNHSTTHSAGPRLTARNLTNFSNASSWNLSLESLRPDDSLSNIGFTARANARVSNAQAGRLPMGQSPGSTQNESPSARRFISNEQTDGNVSETGSDMTETGRRIPAVEGGSRQDQRAPRRRVNITAQGTQQNGNRNMRHRTTNGGDGNGSSSSSEGSIPPRKADNVTPHGRPPNRRQRHGTRRSSDDKTESGSSAIGPLSSAQESLLEFHIDDGRSSIISAASSISGVQDSLDGIRSRLGNPNHILIEDDGQEILRVIQNLQRLMELLQNVLHNDPTIRTRDLARARDALERMMAEAETLLRVHFPQMAPQLRQEITIHDAVRQMDVDSITRLLRMGIDPNLLDVDGNTPLSLVSLTEPIEKVMAVYRALLNGHANPNTPCQSGKTPLYFATKKGDLYAMELLIEHNAGVNVRHQQSSKTLLHIACLDLSPWKCQSIRLLLNHGADLGAISSNGSRALDFALKSIGNLEQVIFFSDGIKPSVIWGDCMTLRECVGAIALLLGRQRSINLTIPSRRIFQRCYTLQGMERLAAMPIQDARALVRERRVEILLQDDVELHDAVRRFHQARLPN